MHPGTRYASYLLRLWQVQNDQQTTWVASIQDPATGEKRPFSSVGALLQFLQTEFGERGSVGDSECQEPIDAGPRV